MPTFRKLLRLMESLSIRRQLLLLVLVVSVPLLAIVGYGIYSDLRQSVVQSQAALRILANMMVSNTGGKIDDAHQILDILAARHSKAEPVDAAHCDPSLKMLHSLLPGYTNIGYTDRKGDIVCSALTMPAGKTINISNTTWYRALLQNKRFTVGPPFIGVISKKWVLVLAEPLWNDQQEMIGGINLSLDLNSYDPHIPIQNLPAGSRYGFFSEDGTMIWRNEDPEGLIGTRPNSEAAKRIVEVRDGEFESTGVNGLERVYSVVPMPQAGWIAFVSVPANAIYFEAKRRAITALALALAAIALMVFLAIFIASRIAKPITMLERTARAIHGGDLSVRAKIAGPREVVAVAQEFNEMLEVRVKSISQLEHYQLHLEDLVSQRTKALQASTEQLQQALNTLHGTQARLVQSEKLAALGSIVAAVAHELNTPLGNCLTVASTLQDRTISLEKKLTAGEALRRSQLNDQLEATRTAGELLLQGLGRAINLVSNFKQVAVDQVSEKRRLFDLKATILKVVNLMEASLRQTPYKFEIDMPDGLIMDSYPGAIEQIVSNLINNSVLHGFHARDHGVMRMVAEKRGSDIHLIFSDDGLGMSSEVCRHVFDPFFTTRLGQGGSGLGMHICYNLVTGPLGGSVEATSEFGRGSAFAFILPIVAPTTEDSSIQKSIGAS